MDKLPDKYETLSSIGTGYSLSFPDFQNVLKNASSDAPIPALLKEWFHVTIATTDDGSIKVSSEDGGQVELHTIYSEVQNNPEMQYTFYQRAMDILR